MSPRHPAVVHFPVALTILSVLADATAWVTRGSAVAQSLFSTGWWTLAGAVVMGAVAIVLGLSDMRHETIQHEAHEHVHYHMRVGFAVFATLGVLFVWRFIRVLKGDLSIGLGYLVVAAVALVLVIYQGWLGGELVFRYGVGVEPAAQGRSNSVAPSHQNHSE